MSRFHRVSVDHVAVLAWLRLRPLTAQPCVGVDTAGPAAATPEAAIDAWWAHNGPEAAQPWIDRASAPAQMPEHPAFTPLNETRWDWRYSSNASLEVNVMAAGAGMWAVDGVGGCTYG